MLYPLSYGRRFTCGVSITLIDEIAKSSCSINLIVLADVNQENCFHARLWIPNELEYDSTIVLDSAFPKAGKIAF